MKTVKTWSNQRSSYTYIDAMGNRQTLKPGIHPDTGELITEETIKLLHDRKPDTKVVVGGAVMTQEYADAIHADCYAKDAMATVHYAEEIFGR